MTLSVPPRDMAEALLREGEALFPGPWADHSRVTAVCAGAIAAACPGMDAGAAYVMGLLHDIGRRDRQKFFAHTVSGYRFLLGLGYEDAARICLTHSFPLWRLESFAGHIDSPQEDQDFVRRYLAERAPDDYDRLIQLCDALAFPKGPVVVERRLVDVALRHGVTDSTVERWRAYLDLKAYFDDKAGGSVYRLLPDIARTTLD